MCSIIGCVGTKSIKQYVLDGLMRLEYRGYDSAGFAIIDNVTQKIESIKVVGGVQNLILADQTSIIDGFIGLGHTRWATHGKQTIENAHPHFDCTKSVSIVHNGIIENYIVLHEELIKKGHILSSETDSELIAHLLEEILKESIPQPEKILAKLVSQLEGMFALVILFVSEPGRLFFVRKGSPLCVGIDHGNICVASDILAFAHTAKEMVIVPDLTVGWITQNDFALFNFDGLSCSVSKTIIENFTASDSDQSYAHYMLKEIHEQPHAIFKTVDYIQMLSDNELLQKFSLSENDDFLSSITLLGCGGSWHAASIGQFFFESIVQIPTSVELASEFRYMPFFYDQTTAYIFLSQSGETADTLEALRMVESYNNARTVGIANVSSSSLVRECKGAFITQAGPEIAVASTKAFSTQLVSMYCIAYRLAYLKGVATQKQVERAYTDLIHAATVLEQTLFTYASVIKNTYAPYYSSFKTALCLGKHISYPFAMEAALKFKEIPYIFAQAYPAGELKHGPLALVDESIPIFVFSVLDPILYKKLLNSVNTAKSRNAHLIIFGFSGQKELKALADVWFEIEPVAPLLAPVAMVGIMQFFVYEIANYLGLPIDKPRNLAKSVTVE
jgi:glucosamine--fructose-6-phosphate aminotransferase (isomerizing)